MTDLFAEKAKDWDANDRRTRLASAIGASMLDNVRLHKDMVVLDFGAGTGLITSRIAPLVKRVVAVDTSQAMLDKLRSKPELKDRVEIVCRDLLAEPLDERFDLIVSAMTMHHVEDTAALLRSFHRHLQDGGTGRAGRPRRGRRQFSPAGDPRRIPQRFQPRRTANDPAKPGFRSGRV